MNNMEPKVEVSQDMITCAFMYCLPRRTYVVSDFVEEAIYLIPSLTGRTKIYMLKMIDREFGDHLSANSSCIFEQEWCRFKVALENSMK